MTPPPAPGSKAHPGIDLSIPRRIHIVGIGGAGMSAIAAVLVAMGHKVSGSDQRDSVGLNRLRSQGVTVNIGHDAGHIEHGQVPIQLVAISTAIPPTNPEVTAAHQLGIPVLRRAEILAAIAAQRRTVAVSGTHGKTTTSSMLAWVLVEAGMRPSFIVGGDLRDVGSGARWDDGEWFVVEADESDATFVELGAEVAVVTNIEADHLDFYGNLAAIEDAFDRFLAEATGPTLACADDPGSARIGRRRNARTYGTDPDADYRILEPFTDRTGSRFILTCRESDDLPTILGEVQLTLPGLHNIRNAAAAIAAAMILGVPFEAGRDALARYQGVARRYELRGTVQGATIIDDYAHNPGKVSAVLAAARQGGWGRVIAVFQPHRVSRTADLWPGFADSFRDADVVVITEVYAAGEAARPGITGKLIVNAILDAHPSVRVVWLPERNDVVNFLRNELRPGDLCLTLGAGDITTLPDTVLEAR